jgi:hypothetical protein
MSQPRPVPLSVGDELHLRDEDYRYGAGPLRLRVTAVLDVQRLPDGPWLWVRGVVLTSDGQERHEREALVRLAVLTARVRRKPSTQP